MYTRAGDGISLVITGG